MAQTRFRSNENRVERLHIGGRTIAGSVKKAGKLLVKMMTSKFRLNPTGLDDCCLLVTSGDLGSPRGHLTMAAAIQIIVRVVQMLPLFT